MTNGVQRPRGDSLWPKSNNRSRSKSTFEVNLYLVAEQPALAPTGLAKRLLGHLERAQILGSYYDLGLGWLAPGARAATAFPQAVPHRPPFEYAIVWEGEAEFVPNAHTGPFGARCACGADLDEALHGFLEEQTMGASATVARIRCACGLATPPGELVTSVATAVTGCYVNFCHVDSTEFAPDLLLELAETVGAPLRVLRERL